MRQVPVIATAVVALAVAAMVALGLWQLLVRLPEKEAYLAQLAGNPAKPVVAFPDAPDDRLLFRQAEATCAPPVEVTRAGAGNAGYRLIANCAGGAGPKVQLGTTHDPRKTLAWQGGPVRGWISHAPDAAPLIAQAWRRRPQDLLLVSATPIAGLEPNTQPDVGLVPNNHLAYAVQWFLFAGVALVIDALAVVRRGR